MSPLGLRPTRSSAARHVRPRRVMWGRDGAATACRRAGRGRKRYASERSRTTLASANRSGGQSSSSSPIVLPAIACHSDVGVCGSRVATVLIVRAFDRWVPGVSVALRATGVLALREVRE